MFSLTFVYFVFVLVKMGKKTELSGDKLLDKKTLIVRGLAAEVSKEDLEKIFSGIGPVQHVVLVTETNEKGLVASKGFGFVTFSVQEDAAAALVRLQGSCVKGSNVNLSYARHRNRSKDEKKI